jgi:hypothetical protein
MAPRAYRSREVRGEGAHHRAARARIGGRRGAGGTTRPPQTPTRAGSCPVSTGRRTRRIQSVQEGARDPRKHLPGPGQRARAQAMTRRAEVPPPLPTLSHTRPPTVLLPLLLPALSSGGAPPLRRAAPLPAALRPCSLRRVFVRCAASLFAEPLLCVQRGGRARPAAARARGKQRRGAVRGRRGGGGRGGGRGAAALALPAVAHPHWSCWYQPAALPLRGGRGAVLV